MDFIILLILGGFIIWVFISIFFPHSFKPRCSYCGEIHRGNKEYWDDRIGKSVTFRSQKCYNSWMKENYICEVCNNYGKYTENTIQHKFQRSYYYFCNIDCKGEFLEKNPDLSYEGYHRHSIPSDLRRFVFKRDKGKCVKCGSKENIHFDHIIPVSKGGSTNKENLELLCQDCNLSKSDKIE